MIEIFGMFVFTVALCTVLHLVYLSFKISCGTPKQILSDLLGKIKYRLDNPTKRFSKNKEELLYRNGRDIAYLLEQVSKLQEKGKKK